jgi:two-component system CheB/CheR fusion protein
MAKKRAKKKTSKKLLARVRPSQIVSFENQPDNFLVVGIGASAGGLEALKLLLKDIPNNLGISFVVIQHLDPNHPSLTASIMAGACKVPTEIAQNDAELERNRIYFMPENSHLSIKGSRFVLTPRGPSSNLESPIDLFLTSLAEARGPRAMAVILSGIGSDGAIGAKAVKASGGFTFAQDPSTAKFDSMPRSAIGTGACDFVENPKNIAKEIIRIARTPKIEKENAESLSNKKFLNDIFEQLQKNNPTNFALYSQGTILRRISRRMIVHKLKDFESYAKYLRQNPEELTALHAELLIHVTGFFRDPEVFRKMKKDILIPQLKRHDPNLPFRVWVPGCSTGEEAYSLAILLFECIDKLNRNLTLQIFATDISETAIQVARSGTYPATIDKDLSKQQLDHFFKKTETGYRVSQRLRESCLFSIHDCTTHPPFAKVDLVSCRNLLIYFSPELKNRMFNIFHYALKPDGLLVLGRSESVGSSHKLFGIVDKTRRIYAKKETGLPVSLQLPPVRFFPETLKPASKPTATGAQKIDLQRHLHHRKVPFLRFGEPHLECERPFEH